MRFLFPLILIFTAMAGSGCQTIQMPLGPLADQLSYQPSAPLIAVCVQDLREKDKIGMVGGTTIKLGVGEASKTFENYAREALHQAGANSVSQGNCGGISEGAAVKSLLSHTRADGLAVFEMKSLHVSSVDILFDPPSYEMQTTVSLYDAAGKQVAQRNFYSEDKSQSVGTKGQGKAVAGLMAQTMTQFRELDVVRDFVKNSSKAVSSEKN